MKKILLIIILFFIFKINYAQKGLYIIYKDTNNVKEIGSKNDTISIRVYTFYPHLKERNTKFIFENGKLLKLFKTKSRNLKSISFSYLNTNNNNPPFLINKSLINYSNSIYYHQMLQAEDFYKMYTAISKFQNFYLIYEKDIFENFYIARKVTLEKLSPSL